MFDTSRWEHQHDLSDKVVAVVGTGRPRPGRAAIQPTVRKLYLFEREPGWVMPKGERASTEAERQDRRKPWHRALGRAKMRYTLGRGSGVQPRSGPGRRLHEKRQQTCLDYISEQFAHRPTCRRLSPRRTRTLASGRSSPTPSTPALKEDNVELVPKAVVEVTASGIVDGDGMERAVDVIVMATGVPGGEVPRPPPCHRAGGTDSRRALGGEPRGLPRHDGARNPDFFTLYGPGTTAVSRVHARSAGRVRSAALKRTIRRRVTCVEVKPTFEALWFVWLQSKMQGTSWAVSNNYSRSSTGNTSPNGRRATSSTARSQSAWAACRRRLDAETLVPDGPPTRSDAWFCEWLRLSSARWGGSTCSRITGPSVIENKTGRQHGRMQHLPSCDHHLDLRSVPCQLWQDRLPNHPAERGRGS